jgi:hypothetical protein
MPEQALTSGEKARQVRKKGIARLAFEAGLTRYFTGKPCKHGHTAERMIRNGACVECLKRNAKEYAQRHPETNARARAKHRVANIILIRQKDKAAHARLRASNPAAEKERQRRFYERKEAKLVLIAGSARPSACELCGESGKTVFDHCHQSGRFRGWLCDRCNRTLGQVKDNVALLAKMISYLVEHNGETDNQEAQRTA